MKSWECAALSGFASGCPDARRRGSQTGSRHSGSATEAKLDETATLVGALVPKGFQMSLGLIVGGVAAAVVVVAVAAVVVATGRLVHN